MAKKTSEEVLKVMLSALYVEWEMEGGEPQEKRLPVVDRTHLKDMQIKVACGLLGIGVTCHAELLETAYTILGMVIHNNPGRLDFSRLRDELSDALKEATTREDRGEGGDVVLVGGENPDYMGTDGLDVVCLGPK
jgi:hypothetical protein